MTFRGLDSRTSMARWGLAAIAVGMVIGATAPAAMADLAAAWDGNRQALVWLVERVLGFGAYLAVTGSVVYGLLLSTKILDAIAHRPITFSLHQDLAASGSPSRQCMASSSCSTTRCRSRSRRSWCPGSRPTRRSPWPSGRSPSISRRS